ncbi:ATP synthase F1 subunit gamma [Rhodococcus rhodnii]|uniref:ATP synthase gamma chain n=2 Tax=Rhodococcus rhodnii TaxID=38312 RepID=R7WM06_9NOCA|nr:ATP synthase F1 subunit gamma [Rhodococcus rhodnii]EOM75064.1 F0F1 ATP synthase gamma subunit [Rhodococcus rhodnii LMG 5362]TXG91160.1 ATP synthase F1 subunit gamma [Rhodococcus rhodnii]
MSGGGEVRARIKSVSSTKKITRAQELIASARVVRARTTLERTAPYDDEFVRLLGLLDRASIPFDHPLLAPRETIRRAAVLVVASDRGFNGGYTGNVVRCADRLDDELGRAGTETVYYVIGGKAVEYFRFHERDVAHTWTGETQNPSPETAASIGSFLAESVVAGSDGTLTGFGGDVVPGLDAAYVVHSKFVSMIDQRPVSLRLAPVELPPEIVTTAADRALEPEIDDVAPALLARAVTSHVFAAMLDASVSDSAARRAAMNLATNNASELLDDLHLRANKERQAQVTQELSEIVGDILS